MLLKKPSQTKTKEIKLPKKLGSQNKAKKNIFKFKNKNKKNYKNKQIQLKKDKNKVN
jgi:hypothetical protein